MPRPVNSAIEELMQSEGISRRTAMRRLAEKRAVMGNPITDAEMSATFGPASNDISVHGYPSEADKERINRYQIGVDAAEAGRDYSVRTPLRFATMEEFEALVQRVEKLENPPKSWSLANPALAQMKKDKEKSRQSETLGPGCAKGELARRSL